MKDETILVSGRDATCIDVKAKHNFLSKKKLSKLLSDAEVQENKKGVIVLKVDQLTDAQLQQVQEIPGAYFLSSEMQLNSATSSPDLLSCREPQAGADKLRFLVKHSSKLISVEVDQIAYFYAENRLNFIKTWNNKTYIIDKTIEEISKLLNKNDFYRINRSYIIAYKSIEEVYTHFNNRLKLKLNINVPEELFVSKDRVAGFKEWLGA